MTGEILTLCPSRGCSGGIERWRGLRFWSYSKARTDETPVSGPALGD